MKKRSGKKILLLCGAAVCVCAAFAAYRNWAAKPEMSFRREDIVSAIPWTFASRNLTDEPLSKDEIEELIALLNGLRKSDFTETFSGGTPDYGISIDLGGGRDFHLNQSLALGGTLELVGYDERQWVIDDDALLSFVREKTGIEQAWETRKG